MKKDIHPENYRLVVFKDTSCDYSFLTKSTVETKDKIVWDDGNAVSYTHLTLPTIYSV